MNEIELYKMSGAGNCFVVLDGRALDVSEYREPSRISELCKEYSTDGLMILVDTPEADFGMEFYNPDGSGGMMCGNGGRCIVAFADYLGIKPSSPDHYDFLAPDGPHSADILLHPEGSRRLPSKGVSTPGRGQGEGPIACDGRGRSERSERSPFKDSHSAAPQQWTIRLGMIDVHGVEAILGGWFLNTGTRHFVKFVENIETLDVEKEGKELRWREEFAPKGSNINFVQVCPDGLHVRTFEKGVEGETLACGTGITASAIAAWNAGLVKGTEGPDGSVCIKVKARRNWLEVDFEPESSAGNFTKVHLTGPAEFI